MGNPDVSIVVPVYNAAASVGDMIRSVLQQTLESWELILVDDGSTDASEAVICRHARLDARIHLVSQPNAGPSAARNLGLSKARAAWIAFIDADDMVTADYLEQLLRPVRDDPGVDMVCAGYYEQNRRNRKGTPLHDFQRYFPQSVITRDQFLDNIFNGLTGVLWSKLFRTEIICANRLSLNTGLRLSEDLLFVLQYARHCRKVALVKEKLYFYNRIHESGLSSGLDLTCISGIQKFNELISAEYSKEELFSVAEVLKRRTSGLALTILKNQASNRGTLKKAHLSVSEELGDSDVEGMRGEDRLLLKLLARGFYRTAVLYVKTFKLIRVIRHAKKNIG